MTYYSPTPHVFATEGCMVGWLTVKVKCTNTTAGGKRPCPAFLSEESYSEQTISDRLHAKYGHDRQPILTVRSG